MNIIRAELLSEIGFVDHGFFDKTGGISEGNFGSLNVGFERGDDDKNVIENRSRISEQFGVKIEDMIILNQQHSDKVHVIDDSNVSEYKFRNPEQAMSIQGDAIITNQRNLLIGVATADCAPVLLCDEDKRYIAVIHSGWKGTLGKITENAVEKLKKLGCKNLKAVIGPSIQKKYFEVKRDVYQKIDRRYLRTLRNRVYFDMTQMVLEKLLKAGVRIVSKLSYDTMSEDNFFSYRRSGGKTGVQFSGIIIKE